MRCSLCGGQGSLTWQEDSKPTNTRVSSGLGRELQRLSKHLKEPAAEIVFLVLIQMNISKGIVGMSQSDYERLTGSSNPVTGRVTDELLLWLQEEGWLLKGELSAAESKGAAVEASDLGHLMSEESCVRCGSSKAAIDHFGFLCN